MRRIGTGKSLTFVGLATVTILIGLFLSTDHPRDDITTRPDTAWRFTSPAHRHFNQAIHFSQSGVTDKILPMDLSATPIELTRGGQNIEPENYVSHRMCACNRCYNVKCRFNETGFLSMNITNVTNVTNLTNVTRGSPVDYRQSGDDISYFYVKVAGRNDLYATIGSDQDRRLDTLPGIRMEYGGTHNITLKLIHTNKSSAYGLDDPQGKELDCPMCLLSNSTTCHLMVNGESPRASTEEQRQLRWVREPKGTVGDMSCALYENGCYHLSLNRLQESWEFKRSAEECFRSRKCVILGDSHHMMYKERLSPWPDRWQCRFDGKGILHNISPDRNMSAFMARMLPPVFQEGDMLRHLSDGFYQHLQDGEHFDGWVFSSGHWDLRDVTVDEYLVRLRQLFEGWSRFREVNSNVALYWNGVPPYSFVRFNWGGLERRTNVKLALADVEAKRLCAEFNISFIPFFDIAFPFYTKSCDTHHYLCPKRACPVGEAQLDLLLRTICQ